MSYDIRVALRKLFIAQWGDPAAVGGYSPDSAASNRVRIHLGEYDDEMPFPQIVLVGVSSTARNPSGYYAVKSGEGYVQKYDGRLDINVFAGSEDDADNPEELADTLGKRVRSIVHANNSGLTDSDGTLLAENIAPLTEPVVRPETDYSPTRYMATVETGYDRAYDPPAE